MHTSWLTVCSAVLCSALVAGVADAACFNEAGARFNLPPILLKAISRVESDGNPHAVNRNRNGSFDLCHMQVNSSWLPLLKQHGITPAALFDPCTCTYVGAWILYQNVQRMGYTWEAIGAFNAKTRSKRLIYARKVAAAMQREGGA